MKEFSFPDTVYICDRDATKIVKLNIFKLYEESYYGKCATYGKKENYVLDHKNYFYVLPEECYLDSPHQTTYFLTEEEIKKYIENFYNNQIIINQNQIKKCKDFLENDFKTMVILEE